MKSDQCFTLMKARQKILKIVKYAILAKTMQKSIKINYCNVNFQLQASCHLRQLICLQCLRALFVYTGMD